MNPCGRVVDYIRRPYSTLARFFKDDEGPPVIIQWYPAAADAPTMPFPSSFMSLDWTSETTKVKCPNWPDEPWLQRPGEIFQAARPFSPWPTPLGLDYSHLCGTEDEFANGATFDPDRDVKYDEQGLPLCCNGPIVPLFPLLVGLDLVVEEAFTPTVCVFPPDLPNNCDVVVTIPPGFNSTIIVSVPDDPVGVNVVRRVRLDRLSGADFFLEKRYMTASNCASGTNLKWFTFASFPIDITSPASPGQGLGMVTINPVSPTPHAIEIRVRVDVT